ncbi:prepilin-type N-terminal cleavage/methylation domain-containing protein [uncultured Ilyobacter sp.]|uniref:prepilin-type N-terminal cleavage/methylation domain-containing protein n=1 Tax=uncultured Ilyobacter sp. TaxID=544433 RepID=UPI002AA78518|nr:prepilin-type N-terminal cleavage/methylation domain-containing protein [uncultured Ilyobacter sp.]
MKKGLSIIESIVAVAILAIVMLLMSPMVKNYGMVHDRINLQNRIDYEFGKTLEIIKRKVRAARIDDSISGKDAVEEIDTTGKTMEYSGETYNVTSELRLVVPNSDNEASGDLDKNYIAFRIIELDGKMKLLYITDPGAYISGLYEGAPVEVISYLEEGEFKYKNGVVLIYLDLDVDTMTGESIEGNRNILDKIRDAAVTRINIDMSNNF